MPLTQLPRAGNEQHVKSATTKTTAVIIEEEDVYFLVIYFP